MATAQRSYTTNLWLFAVGPITAWLAQAPVLPGGNTIAGNTVGGSPGGAGGTGSALGGGLAGGSSGRAGATGNVIAGNLAGASPGGAGGTGNALGGGLYGGAGATGNMIAGNPTAMGTSGGSQPLSPIVLSVDTDFVRAHLQWLGAWVSGAATPLNCALIACDYNLRPVDQLTFQNARVTRLTFSTLDTRLPTPWLLGIELTPGSVQRQKGGGSVPVPPKQRTWTGCNFKVTIDGVGMNKVAQIGLGAMNAPGVMGAVTLHIPSNDLQAIDDWRRSGKTAACAIHILLPTGSPLVALKFRARPTSVRAGASMASVGLSPTLPSLA